MSGKSYHESIDLELNFSSFEVEMSNYLKKYEIDCCVCIAIEQEKAINLLNIKRNDNCLLKNRFGEFFSFKEHRKNALFEMFKKNEWMTNTNQSDLETYVKDIKSEIYIPVKYNDRIFGCIYLCVKQGDISMGDLSELHAIIARHRLYIDQLKIRKVLRKVIIEHIILLNKVYDEKTLFMTKHSYNVALWAIEIAALMNYDDDKITNIYLAALMHDIGKIYIDDKIINKEGKYTQEEYEEIKKHSEYGYNISKDLLVAYNSDIPKWILQHHEKWDGSGYPYGLKGEEIIEEARILKIADALDGMLSVRSYKEKMNIDTTITEIKNCRGKDFDPEIVTVVIEVLSKRLNLKQEIIKEFILPATLIFQTRHGLINLRGHVSKTDDEVLFISKDSNMIFDKSDVESVVLAMERFNVINEYEAVAKQIESNTFIIEEISSKQEEESFSLLWRLNGYLIDIDTKEAIGVIITKISATGITFDFKDDKAIDNELYAVAIPFDDGTKLSMIGKIVNRTTINRTSHYELSFTGIKETTKAEIYRQIFKKQLEIRRQLKQ